MMAGFFDGLLNSVQNPLFLGGIGLMTGGGEGLQRGLLAGNQFSQQRKKQQQQDALAQGLMTMPGLSETDRTILANNPELATNALAGLYANKFDPMADLKRKTAEANYQQTLQENDMFPLKKQQIESQIAQNRAQIEQGRNGKYGLNPIYGMDAQGNPVVMQLGPMGEAVQTKIPDGVRVDLGVKAYEQAQGRERGESYGKAAVNLPIVENASQRILEQIRQIRAEPGIERVTGNVYGRLPSSTNYTDAAKRAQSRIDQIKGGVFLQAYNDLRGAGAITEQEGQAAKAAYARLNDQTMSANEYKQALKEFEGEVLRLREIARARAKGGNVVGAANGIGGPSQSTLPDPLGIR